MLKYTSTQITFSEIPDEIALCINLSNCPCHCKNCHSSYLAEDIGEILTYSKIEKLIEDNKGITTVCFMGGDNDPKLVNRYAKLIKTYYNGKISADLLDKITTLAKSKILNSELNLIQLKPLVPIIKVAWYSGREKLSEYTNINNFDFIKLGPYKEEYGPLDSKTTNQRLFKIVKGKLEDITYKFWKNEIKD